MVEEEETVRIPIPPMVKEGTILEAPIRGLGIHNFYLREFRGGKDVLVKTVVTDFADPGTGCRLAS